MNEHSTGDWARTPERSNMLALRIICWIALRCGRRVACWVLHPISLYFLLFSPGPRRHIKRYLSRTVGPDHTWRDGYRLIHAFATTALDRVYFLRGRMDLFELSIDGVPALEAEVAQGRGAFLLGAHVGSFEAIGASRQQADHLEHLRLAMLMYPDNARQINGMLDAIAKPEFRPHIIALGRAGSMLALRDWLDAGGVIGLLADRTLHGQETKGQRDDGMLVDFLGTPAVFHDSPFRLAAVLRRRVFFMVGLYLGGARYEVHFEPLADFTALPPGSAEREQCIRAAVHAYVARLEALCRAHPYNWFNFHDFWLEDKT